MTSRRNLRWLSTAAYAGMFGFGVVMALLGAILPVIAGRMTIDLAHAGDLFLLMNFAMLASTLVVGPVLDRFGHRWPLLGGSILVALALWLVVQARAFASMQAAIIVLGIGGGALNQSTNTLISDIHGDWKQKTVALNLLGVFFGIGALFIPLCIGSLLQSVGLAGILYLAAGVVLIPAVLASVLVFPQPRHRSGAHVPQLVSLLKQPLIWMLAFLLFFESGNEFIIGGYLTTYLTRYSGIDVAVASYWLAAYWGAMMIARLLIGRTRLYPVRIVQASAVGVAASMLLILFVRHGWAIGAGSVLLGLTIATIFPTVLAEAGSWFSAYSGTVFSILIGVALTGGITLPWVTGRLSQRAGIHTGLNLVILNAAGVWALQTLAGARMRLVPRAH